MRSLIRRHPIASFLILFYGLAWACFVPALLGQSGFGILPVNIPLDPFRLLSIVLFALVPFVVTRIVEGPVSARCLASHVGHVRLGRRSSRRCGARWPTRARPARRPHRT